MAGLHARGKPEHVLQADAFFSTHIPAGGLCAKSSHKRQICHFGQIFRRSHSAMNWAGKLTLRVAGISGFVFNGWSFRVAAVCREILRPASAKLSDNFLQEFRLTE